MNARTDARPSLSSSQPARFGGSITVAMLRLSCLLRDHHFVTPDVHGILVERAWRRARHHLPVQVVRPVVTGAPDLLVGFAVLHGAVQMGADSGKCAPLRLGVNQQYREAAKFH